MALTKRQHRFGAPLTVACGHCFHKQAPVIVPVDSWLYYEGGPGCTPMIFTVSCHGDTINLGIEDVAGFEETMTKLAIEGEPFVVFAGAVNGGG
jgi:hypothetical protein